MIDTDKYEGHTPAPWVVGYPNCKSFPENAVFINGSDGKTDHPWSWSPFFSTTSSGKEISEQLGITLRHRLGGDGEFDGGNTPLADVLLMADAPLLLAEVLRLRSIADDLYAYIVSDADISLKIIEEQMDWRDEE